MSAQKVGILLIDGYPLIPFSCVLEVLRTANRLSNSELFEWRFYAPNSKSVTSNSGIAVSTTPLHQAGNLDILIICAPADAHTFHNEPTLRRLKTYDQQGTSLGTASFGSFILARAGLLDDCRSTVHWEHIPVFKETYPHLDVAFTLYEISPGRFTCSGGTAALDMMLKLVEKQHGRGLAQEISQYFHHDRIRTDIDLQQKATRLDLEMRAPKLIDVIQQMESNIEEPLPLQDIADHCGISIRQMERLFLRYRRQTPGQFYLGIRLEHARQLLLNTNLRVIDIAIAAGIPSPSYFAACYRRHFGSSPRNYRVRALGLDYDGD